MTKDAAAKRLKQDRSMPTFQNLPMPTNRSASDRARLFHETRSILGMDTIEETSPIQENDEDVVNSIRKQFRL
jgi:hypothetical protein